MSDTNANGTVVMSSVLQDAPLSKKRQHALAASLAALCGMHLLSSCTESLPAETMANQVAQSEAGSQDDLPDR